MIRSKLPFAHEHMSHLFTNVTLIHMSHCALMSQMICHQQFAKHVIENQPNSRTFTSVGGISIFWCVYTHMCVTFFFATPPHR